MSKARPLRVTNQHGTPLAVHADAATVYRLHGPKAKIERYEDGSPYDGPSVADLHKEAQEQQAAKEAEAQKAATARAKKD